MTRNDGVVWWITGMAGAGKSTLGRLLAERLRERGRAVLVLDGDALRAALFPRAGYSPPERLELALRYSALCGLIAAQGVDVVCATVSLFPEVWEKNRRELPAYREVLVRAPERVLAARKPDLYDREEHVVGRDAPAPEPPLPDVAIDNDGSRSPAELVAEILAACEP